MAQWDPKKLGLKGVMPSSHMHDSEPEGNAEPEGTTESDSAPTDDDGDEMETPNTSMEMTNSFCDDFEFDNNGSRFTLYSEIKHPRTEGETDNDDLPPYVFRSSEPLFMGGL